MNTLMIEHGDDVNADTSLSDSLMPQVGDSIINIAPDVPDNLDQGNVTLNDTLNDTFNVTLT